MSNFVKISKLFETAKQLISRGYFMACIDLKDAYYSVPIRKDHRRYLKFVWMGQLWQYRALPNGPTTAPRLFTKILKPALASLRRQNHIVMAYLDDILIVGKTLELAKLAVTVTKSLFQKLGFVIHPDKSKLTPFVIMDYLGFTINTNHMTITLLTNKAADIIEACNSPACARKPILTCC